MYSFEKLTTKKNLKCLLFEAGTSEPYSQLIFILLVYLKEIIILSYINYQYYIVLKNIIY